MAKSLLLVASIVVVLLLVIFGPDLVGLYRLEQFISTSSNLHRINAGPWPRLTDVCSGCHGARGNSQSQYYPSLASQPAPYIAAQLHAFASGLRNNPNMGPLAMTMNPREIALLSNYFAKQPATDNRFFEPDAALREKGRTLVTNAGCAACHGDTLMGRDQFPRLAGQGYDYLLKQLDAFASGARNEPTGTMKQIAQAASPADRKAMVTYLASMGPQTK